MLKIAIALAIAAACGGGTDVTAPDSPQEIGTYTLMSLDGRPVPTSISEGNAQLEVVSGTLTLGSGRTIQMTTVFRPSPGAAVVTNTVAGTYVLAGNAFTFSYTHGGTNTGTLNGDTVLFLNEGVTWAFKKQVPAL